jgi:hypothetical protein
MKLFRIPGKRVVWIGGRPVTMTDAQAKGFSDIGKRKGKLKRAADRAWEKKYGK